MSRRHRGHGSRSSEPEQINEFFVRLVRQNGGKIHAAIRSKETICGLYNPTFRKNAETGENERIPSYERLWRLIAEDEDAEVTCGQCLGIIDAICDTFADELDVVEQA
jgi:hypothetical protein